MTADFFHNPGTPAEDLPGLAEGILRLARRAAHDPDEADPGGGDVTAPLAGGTDKSRAE